MTVEPQADHLHSELQLSARLPLVRSGVPVLEDATISTELGKVLLIVGNVCISPALPTDIRPLLPIISAWAISANAINSTKLAELFLAL
jgi:hypothetical protein